VEKKSVFMGYLVEEYGEEPGFEAESETAAEEVRESED
jgi:hypothetical protein